jgi:hypothetical protein
MGRCTQLRNPDALKGLKAIAIPRGIEMAAEGAVSAERRCGTDAPRTCTHRGGVPAQRSDSHGHPCLRGESLILPRVVRVCPPACAGVRSPGWVHKQHIRCGSQRSRPLASCAPSRAADIQAALFGVRPPAAGRFQEVLPVRPPARPVSPPSRVAHARRSKAPSATRARPSSSSPWRRRLALLWCARRSPCGPCARTHRSVRAVR